MSPHDAEDRGQTESPPRELGGEEGVEDAAPGFLVHAATRIRHLQVNIPSLREVVVQVALGEVGPVAVHDAGGD